jgi:PAS domain S-box-containing protein
MTMEHDPNLVEALAREVRRREEAERALAILQAQHDRVPRDLRNSLAVLRHQIALRERAEAIIDSSEDAIVAKNLESLVTSWNRGAERIFGYAAAEMIGRRITLLIPPDRQVEEEQILSRIVRGERVEHFVTVRLRKDRPPIAVSVTVSPIKNSAGAIIGASHVARDITDQKRMEIALRCSEERLRQMADAMPAIVWSARADGSIEYYNRRWYEFIGADPRRERDRDWMARLHPDDAEPVRAAWARAVAQGSEFRMEFRLREAVTGEYRWFMGHGLPLPEEPGKGRRWYGTYASIHELKKTQDELVRAQDGLEERVAQRTAELAAANEELDAFSYSVSHDLRAPLRVIDGFSKMLLEDCGANLHPRGLRLLQMVRSETQRAGEMIDRLLAFSRFGRTTLARGSVNMTALARDAWREASAAEPERSIEVSLGELPPAEGDGKLLRQVFVNLFSNALKFTRKCASARVELTGHETADEVIYEVRDNGAGFDPAFADKLFTVFHRLHSEEEFEGHGVGLAVVQRIIQQHGGRVWAEGRLHGGATFRCALPRAANLPEGNE